MSAIGNPYEMPKETFETWTNWEKYQQRYAQGRLFEIAEKPNCLYCKKDVTNENFGVWLHPQPGKMLLNMYAILCGCCSDKLHRDNKQIITNVMEHISKQIQRPDKCLHCKLNLHDDTCL